MSMFTLAISCLTTSNLPWFMDLTFQVPMQYCSLQHWTLLLSPVTSTTGSNRQIWPWNTEWSRAKAKRVLPRESTGHTKHSLPTTQEKTLQMDITRWSTPKSGWLYSLQPKMEKLYTVSKNKTGSWLWLRSWTPIAKFRLKLKKISYLAKCRYHSNSVGKRKNGYISQMNMPNTWKK